MSAPKPLNETVHQYLVVKLPDQEVDSIIAFKLLHQINDHVRVSFTATIADQFKDQFLKFSDVKTKVEIYLRSVTQMGLKLAQPKKQSADQVIFKGLITKLEVIAHQNDYKIDVEAASHSYELDIKRRKRSFKDKTQKYSEMVEFIQNENKATGAKCTYNLKQTWIMDKFFMQYEETDWEFLKRMASRLHTGLVADPLADQPTLNFGVSTTKPDDGAFTDCNFSVKQDSKKYHYEHSLNPEVTASDFVYYIIKDSRKQLQIGDEVTLAGHTLYVAEVTLELSASDLKYHYILVSQKGLRQSVIYNSRIQGQSITAYVVNIEKDQVRLHLEFDKTHDAKKDCLFPVTTPYTAENHTGWYMMPEQNDPVKLYFPDRFENNAYVITTVRQKALSPKIETDAQYLRNKTGKQMMAGTLGLRFTTERNEQGGGADQLVRVHARGGVQIRSDQTINIHAAWDLMINCKNAAAFTAQNELLLASKTKNVIRITDKIQCEGTLLDKQSKAQAALPVLAADLSGIIFSTTTQAKPDPKVPPKDVPKKEGDGKNKSRFIQFDNSGEGYSSVNRDPAGDDNWAKPEFIAAVKKLAKRWHEIDSNNWIWFGDFSRKNGEPMKEHSSHKNGDDVDLYLVYKKINICDMRYKSYNKEKCQKFVNLLTAEFPEFKERLFGDKTIKGLKAASGNIYEKTSLMYQHRHHFHLGF